MIIYATNTPANGYEFCGAFASMEEAQKWASERGHNFAHWWADDEEGVKPDWTRYSHS